MGIYHFVFWRDLLDISPTLTEAAGAIVDDSFTRCFKSIPPEPWNWNVYLFPFWCLGVVVRYLILFPMRVLVLTIGWIVFLAAYFPVHVLLKGHDKLRKNLEHLLLSLFSFRGVCGGVNLRLFVASWTGVVKYHGPRPSMRPKQVFVCNHTSMIDFIILEQITAFAVIMQKHPSWVGKCCKSTILESVGCIWFNRSRQRIVKPWQERRFELGCLVCPIAIKYNKIFVGAFWTILHNAFLRLMTSWGIVCDVWYLEPQSLKLWRRPLNLQRGRGHYFDSASLKKVPWGGYLKYSRPSPKHRESNSLKRAVDVASLVWLVLVKLDMFVLLLAEICFESAVVLVKTHNQEVYAVFNKKISSFSLFDGQVGSNFNPYQNSTTFCLLENDQQYITKLRNWCQTFQIDAGISDYLMSLKDIKERVYFDLVCMVIILFWDSTVRSSNEWVLFLWDGTDAPPLSLNAKLEDQNPIRLQIESAPLPTNVLDKCPCVGTTLRVIASCTYENLGHHFHYIGSWMRFRNLVCEVDSGLWKGLLISGSKIQLLAEDDYSVIELTTFETSKFAMLMDVVTLSKEQIQMRGSDGSYLSNASSGFWTPAGRYRINITLEDPTARIHALLCNEDAENFFGCHTSLSEYSVKMNKLLGLLENNDDSPRNLPWIQCCIQFRSFNQVGTSSGSRCYYICCTELVLK
ncbi:Glycerol-3-phosphate acyltransferase 9 [Camellia lanceoleosa]|uniref:Glycerol-3-phosphate acyltransferase 9 n=1 Tax=Camellia lanceoleosa TaxID=1840588 RepID=A0ACC0IJE2_9ERIC|nr:Glycerol-3-phosphate acyltransferase 9 [Camellia lanceoleosa]